MFDIVKWKLWLIGAGIALAFVGILVWRVFDAGKNEEKIKSVEAALGNIRRAAEARAQERSNPTNAETDNFNRDRWGPR
jgi:predicted negative regulator of RcsB-dependent stress response